MRKVVTLKLEEKLIEDTDRLVDEGYYETKSDFFRDAIRRALEGYRKQEAQRMLAENFGRGKRLGLKPPTDGEYEDIREETFKEMLKGFGLKDPRGGKKRSNR